MSKLSGKNPALSQRGSDKPGAPIQVGLGLATFVVVIMALMAFRAPRADAAGGIETVSDPFVDADPFAATLRPRAVPLQKQ